ncbi:MAG: hypothetical protein WA139_03530 [Candidatus Aenigmatarchaeota archaeon]
MGNIESDISFALKNQRNIIIVDDKEDRRKKGYKLVAPVLKEFCIEELKIEKPETPIFDFSKTDDLEKWADTLCGYYEKFCKDQHYLLNSFQDYIMAMNNNGVFPIMHNIDVIVSWDEKLRDFYGYHSQIAKESTGAEYSMPRAVATLSKSSWKERNDYNHKLVCCWNPLEYNKKKWELEV